VKVSELTTKPEYQFPRRVTLLKDEKVWLGRSVWLSDGRFGQVWAMCQPARKGHLGSLWVAADGVLVEVAVSELERCDG
jgi:hypothetical protein